MATEDYTARILMSISVLDAVMTKLIKDSIGNNSNKQAQIAAFFDDVIQDAQKAMTSEVAKNEFESAVRQFQQRASKSI